MIDKPHIVPVALTDKEFQVLEELARAMGLAHERILIQGLRLVQLYWAGKVTIKDDGPPKSYENHEYHELACLERWPSLSRCTCAKSVAELTKNIPLHFMSPEQRAKLRPANYGQLSQEEQWEIDRRFGILDWAGKTCQGCGDDCTGDLYILHGHSYCPGCAKADERFSRAEGVHDDLQMAYTSRLMAEPHRVSRHTWLHGMWWLVRGVTEAEDFRRLCKRCGRTGQAHFSLRGCWRFKR